MVVALRKEVRIPSENSLRRRFRFRAAAEPRGEGSNEGRRELDSRSRRGLPLLLRNSYPFIQQLLSSLVFGYSLYLKTLLCNTISPLIHHTSFIPTAMQVPLFRLQCGKQCPAIHDRHNPPNIVANPLNKRIKLTFLRDSQASQPTNGAN